MPKVKKNKLLSMKITKILKPVMKNFWRLNKRSIFFKSNWTCKTVGNGGSSHSLWSLTLLYSTGLLSHLLTIYWVTLENQVYWKMLLINQGLFQKTFQFWMLWFQLSSLPGLLMIELQDSSVNILLRTGMIQNSITQCLLTTWS